MKDYRYLIGSASGIQFLWVCTILSLLNKCLLAGYILLAIVIVIYFIIFTVVLRERDKEVLGRYALWLFVGHVFILVTVALFAVLWYFMGIHYMLLIIGDALGVFLGVTLLCSYDEDSVK